MLVLIVFIPVLLSIMLTLLMLVLVMFILALVVLAIILLVLVLLRVYQGLPKTHSVSKMGRASLGTVLDFGTPRHTGTLTMVSRVFVGILVS